MNDAFEKQLRDAWAKQTFPVDPDHRAAMEEMLRKRDRRRPLIFWWLGGLLLLVVIGAAGLVWFATRDVANVPSGTEAHVTIEAGSAVTDKPMTLDSLSMLDNRPAASEPGVSTQAKVTADQPKGSDKAAHSIPSERTARPSGRQTTAKANAGSNARKVTDAKQPGIAGAGNARVETGTGTIAGEPATSKEVIISTRENKDVGLSEAPSLPAHDMMDNTGASVADMRSPISVEPIPGLDVTQIETSSPEVIAAASITNHRRWYLFAETAGTYIPANEPQSPVGWQLHAGAGAGFSLMPRLEGLVSAGYMLQDGGFSFSKSSTVRQLGFGVRSAFNTLAPDRLHHLYVKAGVQYRLRRHILSARAGLCYLYGAQGDITVVQADQLSSGTVEQTTRTWLNTNGLRRVFGVADLGYGYQLTPALSAVAGLTWRPSPVDHADDALSDEGYIWKGNMPAWQGFLSLQYRFYGNH